MPIAGEDDRAELVACVEELYATLGQRRVASAHAETDTLVDNLLARVPAAGRLARFRRRVASAAQSDAVRRADLVLEQVERVAPHVVVGADPAQAVGADRVGLHVPRGVDELHVDVFGLTSPAEPADQCPEPR